MNELRFSFVILSALATFTLGNCQAEGRAAKPATGDGIAPPLCGPHEKYILKKTACPPDSCQSLHIMYMCIANQTSKPGCVCEPGYKRWNGKCISQDQCPPIECLNDPHAIRGCNNRCGRTCDTYNTQTVCTLECILGCDCAKGYVYDKISKRCVLPKDCPKKKCNKPHEMYTDCLLGECRAKTCDQVGWPIPCPRIIPPCKGGCICEPGYVYDKKGNCIPMKKCPTCAGDPNAVSGCGHQCDRRCSIYECKKPIICNKMCQVNGCKCRDGYVYDDNTSKCVEPCDCTPVCGDNEEWNSCGSACPEVSCAYPNPEMCTNTTCVAGCFCKSGYIRSPDNECVLPEECGVECINDPHAIRGCNNRCGRTCDTYNTQTVCTLECILGCDCAKGYVYDEISKICVLPKDCPKKKCNKPHEMYTDCLLGECRAKTCDQVGWPIPCPRIIPPCKGGCICEPGYVYDNKGNCIPMKKCPTCAGDPNAVSGCGHQCDKRCSNYDCKKPIICNKMCQVNGCKCRDGYVYDDNTSKCVEPCDCTPVCGDNEEWNSCGSACPEASCAYPNPAMCTNTTCVAGCFCKSGYIRSPDNECVLPEECGDYFGCCGGANQTYVECTFRCPQHVCPKTDWPMACKPPRNCPGGCGCLPGYRWDSNNECIWAEDCPEIPCTRPNTYWHPCSSPDLMEDCTNRQNQEDLPPPDICKPWCICEKGYFRDASYNCVLAADCPP